MGVGICNLNATNFAERYASTRGSTISASFPSFLPASFAPRVGHVELLASWLCRCWCSKASGRIVCHHQDI